MGASVDLVLVLLFLSMLRLQNIFLGAIHLAFAIALFVYGCTLFYKDEGANVNETFSRRVVGKTLTDF